MQRPPMNTVLPRAAQQPRSTPAVQQSRAAEGNGQGTAPSPALQLAERIRNEQGKERAQQFLLAMEPFLAPAERSHIAGKIGVSLPQRPVAAPQQPQGSDTLGQMRPPFGTAPFSPQQGGNPLQMMQMLSGLGGKGQKGGMGADPLALAQLLGSVMGNKQK